MQNRSNTINKLILVSHRMSLALFSVTVTLVSLPIHVMAWDVNPEPSMARWCLGTPQEYQKADSFWEIVGWEIFLHTCQFSKERGHRISPIVHWKFVPLPLQKVFSARWSLDINLWSHIAFDCTVKSLLWCSRTLSLMFKNLSNLIFCSSPDSSEDLWTFPFYQGLLVSKQLKWNQRGTGRDWPLECHSYNFSGWRRL